MGFRPPMRKGGPIREIRESTVFLFPEYTFDINVSHEIKFELRLSRFRHYVSIDKMRIVSKLLPGVPSFNQVGYNFVNIIRSSM